MNFSFLPVASEFVLNDEALMAIIGPYVPMLEQIGGKLIREPQENPTDPLIFFVATGGTENIVLSLLNKYQNAYKGLPVYLLAHPGNNSLPASLEILAKLQQDGLKGQILYLKHANDERSFELISEAVHSLAVFIQMKNARIGCLGVPSDWLIASKPAADTIANSWGPKIIPVESEKVLSTIRALKDNVAAEHFDSLTQNATEIIEPDQQAISDVVRVYMALKQIATEENLTALTIRCFDLVLELKTTGCFALAELADEGIIAGCEGDLVSTIGLLWCKKLLGLTAWMANPAQLDTETNRLWIAHCTVPRTLVRDYKLRSHFESGLGVGIQGSFAEDSITLIRIGGSKLEKIWLAEGVILQNGQAENLCRTQIEIQLDNFGSVDDLLNKPLGNHLIMVNGRHARQLQQWWSMMIAD